MWIPKLSKDVATCCIGNSVRTRNQSWQYFQLSNKSSSSAPPTMPVICSVEFVNELVHCTAITKQEKVRFFTIWLMTELKSEMT